MVKDGRTHDGRDRYVTKGDRKWRVMAPGNPTPESEHRTKSLAEKAAKRQVAALGGGEVRLQGARGKGKGKFIDSDTVAPSNDPPSRKDKKH